MTQGELEKIPKEIERAMNQLQIRIMDDIVRRIRINGFSTASADWQFRRLKQLGMSEKQIKEWIRLALDKSEKEIEKIYSDDLYEHYMKEKRAYDIYGRQQVPFEQNQELQQLIEAVKKQTNDTLEKITGSMGFVKRGATGGLQPITLSEFYTRTLDDAMYDIHSGAFDYNTVLQRTIEDMTTSGIRWIDYESGWHNRVPVAARRAVMTGFRQVQGKINEQVGRELETDSYEVTVHIGARPTHQPWEGKVWTMEELHTVCGLGEVTGLHGANCYHDYNAFIPGVSVRTYTDEEIEEIHEQENTPKKYLGKDYTTYEALQRQRQLETRMRKYREDAHLLEVGKEGLEGEAAEALDKQITLKKARFQGLMQEYVAFSDKMNLPLQKERIYQDGLKVDMKAKKNVNRREERGRRIHFGAKEDFARDAVSLAARKVENKGYNNLFVQENVKLSPKELRQINNQITEAKNLLNIFDTVHSKFVIVENDRNLAAYNPRTDTFYINRKMADEKNIMKYQASFTCPDNPNSTMVHEMYHWKDAEEYRNNEGPIIEAGSKSLFSQWERKKAFEELEKLGLTNPSEVLKISGYAFVKLLANEFEEVYTEYRTAMRLRE